MHAAPVRSWRLFALALIATVVAFVASSTRMYMWWGGSSAPARFLVPILPLLAPMIAVALQRRAIGGGALDVGVLLLAVSVAWPRPASSRRNGSCCSARRTGSRTWSPRCRARRRSRICCRHSRKAALRAPLAQLAPWVVAALLALAIIAWATRWRGRLAGFAAVSVGLIVFVVCGAVLAGAPASSQQAAIALTGRLELMRALDGPSMGGFDYSMSRRLSDDLLLARSTVRVSRTDGNLVDGSGAARRTVRSAARTFRRAHRGQTAGGGIGAAAVSVMIGAGITDRARRGRRRPTPLEFDLPVQVPVWLAIDGEAAAASVQQIEIVPEAIVPRRSRAAAEFTRLKGSTRGLALSSCTPTRTPSRKTACSGRRVRALVRFWWRPPARRRWY